MPKISNLRVRVFSKGEESLICRRMSDNLKFLKSLIFIVLQRNHPEAQRKKYHPEPTRLLRGGFSHK
jgi:hypothetical protein